MNLTTSLRLRFLPHCSSSFTRGRLPCWSPSRRRILSKAYSRRDGLESEFDRMFDAMTRKQQQEFDRMFEDVDRMTRSEGRGLSRQRGNVQIQKSEERTGNSYRYYESVTVTRGHGPYSFQTAQMTTSPLGGFLTLLMMAAAVVYAFVTYRFNKNYQLSTFRQDKRMELSLLWPALLVSPEFRQKFGKVVNPGNDQTPRSED